MFSRPIFRTLIGCLSVVCLSASTIEAYAQKIPVAPSRHNAKSAETPAQRDQKALHLLNRITFGPRPGDLEDVERMGVDKFIDQQLNPASIQLSPQMTQYLAANETINASTDDLFAKYSPQALARELGIEQGKKQQSPEQREAYKKAQKDARTRLYNEAGEARLRRAVESPCQLQEVMTDFWFNHFNVSNDKGLVHLWTGTYEQQAIRPFALGKFRDLVSSTAHHPAMLFYLDNWQNTKANYSGRGRFKGLNENFARELMELHTLGVDGGYTQKDVVELARVLTGLGLPPQNQRANPAGMTASGPYGATFDPNRHDFTDKTVLGVTIKGQGEAEVDQAITLLCRAPATAHHISYQLAQYFVADEPPKSLVDRLTRTFESSDGDIKVVMNELLHSSEFWDPKYENKKFKNPYRYVVSSLRAANVSLTDYKPVFGFFTQLGMPLYRCQTPDGYKNTQVAWLSPDSLLRRIQFATGVGTGKMPGNPLAPLKYEQVNEAMRGLFSQKTLSVVASAPPPMRSSALLGSPEFMNY